MTRRWPSALSSVFVSAKDFTFARASRMGNTFSPRRTRRSRSSELPSSETFVSFVASCDISLVYLLKSTTTRPRMPPLRICSIFGFSSARETSVTMLATVDAPFAGKFAPRHLTRAHRDLHGVDAEQADAAQDERKHIDVELMRHGVAAGGHETAVLRRL